MHVMARAYLRYQKFENCNDEWNVELRLRPVGENNIAICHERTSQSEPTTDIDTVTNTHTVDLCQPLEGPDIISATSTDPSAASIQTRDQSIEREPHNVQQGKHFSVKGLSFAILSAACFATTGFLVKMATSIPFFEVVMIRSTLQIVLCAPCMIWYSEAFIPPNKKELGYVVLRCVTGSSALLCINYAFQNMPLADANVIVFTSPVWTALFGYVFLKEKWSYFDAVATLFSIAGVTLIVRPPFLFPSKSRYGKSTWFPEVVAVSASILVALAYVSMRKLTSVKPRLVVMYFSLGGLILGTIVGTVLGTFQFPHCGTYDKWYTLATGVLGFTGQLFLTKSLQTEKAALVSLVRTFDIVFVFILQAIFLQTIVTGYSIGGAVLVIVCNILVCLKKWYRNK